jgi:hypothetical protein
MRVRASLSAAAALSAAAILVACGLDMGGLATGPDDGGSTSSSGTASSSGASSGTDSSSGTGSGSSSGDASAMDSTAPSDAPSPQDSTSSQDVITVVETGGPCTTQNGCYVIPGGWTPVVLSPDENPACPTGFANASPTDVVEGPNTSAACQCSCSVTTQTCENGAIAVHWDTGGPGGGGCGLQGQPQQDNNAPPGGSCDTDMYPGGTTPLMPSYKSIDLQFTPPAFTGACTATGTPTGNITYASQDRTCVPDSQASAGCNGNQCTPPNVPGPYKFCIAQGGNHNCPGGAGGSFTVQHVVGTGVTLSCSGCGGCTVNGTCSGGTMQLFTDKKCTAGELDIPVDDKCHQTNAQSDTYGSYKYVANAPTGVACQAQGTSTAQGVSLDAEETICCLP